MAAAVICFEWLQRPENLAAGYVTWSSYRSKEHPNAIKILHHKTDAMVWHPLEETTDDGTVKFYEEAESVLAKTASTWRADGQAGTRQKAGRAVYRTAHVEDRRQAAGRTRPAVDIHLRRLAA